MAHPYYGQAQHHLERITIKLYVPTPENLRLTRVTANGYARTRRAALWSVQEQWGPEEDVRALSSSTWIQTVALAAAQDLPTTDQALQMALAGRNESQPALDF